MYLCYFCMSYYFVSNKIVLLLIPFLSLCQSQRLLVWSTGEQWVSCTRCSSAWVSSSFLCSPTLSQTGAGSRSPSLCPTCSSCVITGKKPNKQKGKKNHNVVWHCHHVHMTMSNKNRPLYWYKKLSVPAFALINDQWHLWQCVTFIYMYIWIFQCSACGSPDLWGK